MFRNVCFYPLYASELSVNVEILVRRRMRLVHYICVADGDGAIGCGEVSRIKGCPSVISVETWDVATISAVLLALSSDDSCS